MCVRIGILYIKGSMPIYEEFGNLPNYIVRRCEELFKCDMVIVPPGYIVETRRFQKLAQSLVKYYENGGIIVGVCSGFQFLSREVITRYRSIKCVGLIDVIFSPLICTERCRVEIMDNVWMFKNVKEIEVFHAHTFAPIFIGRVKIVGISRPRRINYFERDGKIISIVSDRDERCIGILPHKVLNNPKVVENICNKLGIKDFDKHREENLKIIKEMKRELGINTGIIMKECTTSREDRKIVFVISSTMTSDGKTFITTGIAGQLRLRGFRTYVLKLGGDVRDIHPALYLIKEPVRDYASIRIRGKSDFYGWCSPDIALSSALSDYDVVIIEGVMGLLTGESYRRPGCEDIFSTLHFIEKFKIPHVLVLSPCMGGLEDAFLRLKAYLEYLSSINNLPVAVILNRCYDTESPYINKMYELCMRYGVSFYVVPEDKRLHRSTHPEVDLDVDRYALSALELVGRHVDLDQILNECERCLIRYRTVTMEGKLKNEESVRSRE